MKKCALLLLFSISPLYCTVFQVAKKVGPQTVATVAKPTRLFNKLPVLETKNLRLRSCKKSDADDLFKVHGDPEVVKHTPMELDPSAERTKYWIEWRLNRQANNEPAPWAMEHKKDNRVIGLCGFYTFEEEKASANLLVTFNRAYDKKLVAEALDAAIACGFNQMHLNRVNFLINPEQTSAINLCEDYAAHGLVKIGTIPECLISKGKFQDRVLYCMLRKNFKPQADKS